VIRSSNTEQILPVTTGDITATNTVTLRTALLILSPIATINSIFFALALHPTPPQPRSPLLKSLNHTQIQTPGRTRLNERSARRRDLYLHSTQHSQEMNMWVLRGIRTRGPNNRAAETYALDRAAARSSHTGDYPTHTFIKSTSRYSE
jgi:hypothetical protein